MKKLMLTLGLLLFSCLPCHALESQFLEDISGVLSVKPESAAATENGIILNNCAITLQGFGQGSIGTLRISDEQPGKIGQLDLENIQLPGIFIKNISYENINGNFAAIAPALPLLMQMQDYAIVNPDKLVKELPSLKAFLPALKKFHIEKMSFSGIKISQKGADLEIKSGMYNDFNPFSTGPGQIQGFQVRQGGPTLFTLADVSWEAIAFNNIEAILNMDASSMNSNNVKPSDIQDALNMKLQNLQFNNARVPVLGISLGNLKLNLDSHPGNINLGFSFQNLHIPGMLLAMVGLENTPEIASFDTNLHVMGKYDDENYAAIQKFTFHAANLFEINGNGGVEGTIAARGDDVTFTNVALNFQNQGLVNCMPEEMKEKVRAWFTENAPAFSPIADQLLSGQANSVSLSFANSTQLDTFNIEVN